MLRTRLMFGLVLLLIILLSMGVYSISECSRLGKSIDKLGRDYDATGRSVAAMKHNCSLMTEALWAGMSGNRPPSEMKFDRASQVFEKALRTAQDKARRSPEESSVVAEIATRYQDYRSEAQKFMTEARQSDPALRDTAAQVSDRTMALLDSIDQLSSAHGEAATAEGKQGGAQISNTIRLICLLMIIALGATMFAWMGLNRGLIDPLRQLTTSIRQIGEGNLDQRVPVLDNYELGTLARSFNQMADQLKQYRTSASVELMRLNQTIRATLASFPDPIFVLNSEGAVDFRNPEADQLAVQLLFSGVTRLPKQVDEKVEHVRLTGQDYLPTLFREAIKFRLDGQDRYFLPRIVLLRDDKRATFGVAVILEDVTRMLLLDDVKSNLISTVSHELKTPLTSVRMALYLLFEKTVGTLNDKQMDLVATAREDADRLLRTLNDLLDLAKLEQGPSQLSLSRALPGELLEEAVRGAGELAHSAQLPISIEVAPDLPAVQVDRQRIAYVFSNLVTNAIKYSPEGAAIVVAAAWGHDRAGREGIRFSVRDRGPGISAEHQEHIFERFYRVPGTRKSGAGLGLSIAREIVVGHGGEMGIISTPGEGSEFFFVLPLRPAAALEEAVVQNA